MTAFRIRPTGWLKSSRPVIAGCASSSPGDRTSASTTTVESSPVSSARPWAKTLGSLSTYTTRAPGVTRCAIWWVFCAVGRPEPRSRNCETPWPAMYVTARPSAARLSRAPLPPSDMARIASSATARSTAKLSWPPRIASYTRATLGTVVSMSGGAGVGPGLARLMPLSAMSWSPRRRANREENAMIFLCELYPGIDAIADRKKRIR